MQQLSPDQLQLILQQLDQALNNHDQWFKAVNRTLVCRIAPKEADLSTEAHQCCEFGQWFYHDVPQALLETDSFRAIEQEHRLIHESAARLLRASTHAASLSEADYDHFADAVQRLREVIDTLKRELTDRVYNRDPLTGAHVRLGLLNDLREQHDLVVRQVHPCSVVMMDLDRFKSINDTYGHLVGDRVLAWAARHLMAHLRPYDKVFRYGGEAFLFYLPGIDTDKAYAIVDRLRAGLAEQPVATGVSELTLQVTASYGIAALEPDATVSQTLNRADIALYAAKIGGRNSVRVWEPGM